ncbi:MAG TPA: arginine--tRNA ligase [Candidatus Paceibacterota bacterium]|nr:arginine--tRNA ligase [Candidatus Paceibacterota bacterium]HPT18071.1 arginine--tRNA ligase [Candidatus Paceibacterota bacterium]
MKERIKNLIRDALKNLEIEWDSEFVVEHPENFNNGDYSTNVALACSKQLEKTPRDLAVKIVEELLKNKIKEIEKIEIAGPGFINFYLSREFFTYSVKEILKQKENWGKEKTLLGKKVMIEYTQPNPFKPFHIGHLMSNAIGESISRIVEFSGAEVIRANYQGDVGPHVAKAIYGLKKFGLPDTKKTIAEKARFIGEIYVKGNDAYENDENAKKEIDIINKKIYDKTDDEINKIYNWGRKITLEAFEEIYKLLGTKFDKYYFESEMAEIGKKIVEKNIGNIFEESDGAIVFHGEKYDPKLHTRVFVNSQQLPTYEAKELGLTLTKFKKNLFGKKLDLSIVTTASEQAEYMRVVQKAISIMHPDLEKRMKHITHGMMRLADGKMSSRKGNIVTGESLLNDSLNMIREKISKREFSDIEKENIAEIVGVSSLKYSILKSSIGSDIIFDFEKSISFEGDSGPYLQYTAVRANSIIQKSKEFNLKNGKEIPKEITDLEKMLYQFVEIVNRSYKEFAPHYIATYLVELASAFNTFYGNTKILENDNKYIIYHLELVKSFYQTMKNGLWLLGIKTPEKM